jgi:hypothetical protein
MERLFAFVFPFQRGVLRPMPPLPDPFGLVHALMGVGQPIKGRATQMLDRKPLPQNILSRRRNRKRLGFVFHLVGSLVCLGIVTAHLAAGS